MKKRFFGILCIFFVVAGLYAQGIDNPLSLSSRPLSPRVLSDLGLKQAEIRELLRYQQEYRLTRERTSLELNLIKAKLAQMLYYPDSNEEQIAELLKQASDLRLEQEMAQVRSHLKIRRLLGEELWVKLRERERFELSEGQQKQGQNSNMSPNSPSGNSSGASAGSSGPGGNGGSSSSGR